MTTTGINLPDRCLRDRGDCRPLAQVASEGLESFICCGHNMAVSRSIPTDRFRVCWKNDQVDELSDWDERDMKDTISVLAQALSVDENMPGKS